MEDLSIGITAIPSKDNQIITLIEAPDLCHDHGMDDSNSAVIHHVLESPSTFITKSIASSSRQPHCFLCNAKLCVSGRGAIDIFSKNLKTTTQNLDVDSVISKILNFEIGSSSVHSTIICKKCYKLINNVDSVEAQLESMRQEIIDKYQRTLLVVKEHDFIEDDYIFDSIGINAVSKDDVDYKIYPVARNKIKRGRKTKRGRPNFVKLEVKEEPEDIAGISLTECEELTDISMANVVATFCQGETDFIEDHGELEFDIDEDTIEMDGLDIGHNPTFLQLSNDTETILINENLTLNNGNSPERMGKYKCRFCQTKGTFAVIQKHLLENHFERLFECEVCEQRFSSNNQLLEHLDEHIATGMMPYPCSDCDSSFALPRQLKDHNKSHNCKTMTCAQCSKRFRSELAMQEHMNIHTGNKPYLCPHCGKGFTGKNILKAHLKTHMIRQRPHHCKVCSKSFLTLHHLQDHTKIHLNKKDYICETCGRGFSSQRSLDLHCLTHTGIKNFMCRVCGKAFARKGEVDDHERIHTGEKPFQCEICGSTFSQRSNLQSHKKATHYKERNYSCNICSKAFKRRRLLNYHHMSVHTGERPFKCDFCNAAFVYPEHYKKHLRIHTGEKPFKCEICSKAFNSRDNKNAHKFIHSDKKQYECTLCGIGFMRKPQLCVHIQQHGQTDDVSKFIKVNPATVVDQELRELDIMRNSSISMKIDEDNVLDSESLETMHLVRDSSDNETVIARPLQLVDSGDTKYIIHATGDKPDENVGHFLASLQGQVVEVREDMGYTAELTQEQFTQVARVAAQMGVQQEDGSNNSALMHGETFELPLDDDKEDSIHSSHSQSDPLALSNSVVVRQSQLPTMFSHLKKSSQASSSSTVVRHNRSWSHENDEYVDS